ncbi:MAG: hypothetical protein ACLQSR_08180 [Limisphaerales bacterium]
MQLAFHSPANGRYQENRARILVEVGKACAAYHDKIMRNVPCKVLQVDEVWPFTNLGIERLPLHERQVSLAFEGAQIILPA